MRQDRCNKGYVVRSNGTVIPQLVPRRNVRAASALLVCAALIVDVAEHLSEIDGASLLPDHRSPSFPGVRSLSSAGRNRIRIRGKHSK